MRVFLEKDLQARRIPQDSAHRRARELLDSVMAETYKKMKGVLSAVVVIGSSTENPHNQPSVTSDMDVLMFVEDGDGQKFPQERKELNEMTFRMRTVIRRELHLPLELLLVLKSQMEPTQTRYDKQFLRHAVWAANWGGLVCGRVKDVEHFYELCPELALSTALAYIDRKVAKAHTALAGLGSLEEEEMIRLQADLLNAPFHAARRMFTLANQNYIDSRGGLIQAMREFGEEGMEENLKLLRRYAQEYSEHVRCKRDRLPSGHNPFSSWGMDRPAEEFFAVMKRMREICVAVGS